ncbi:cytochrome P450 [Sistotremastrum suecicum HHB10207 ss-3]|uniref:Cytochrome P450 n=1 Tax=Sistotremastrum suecicum HHB10207 ss-3 TaxID=1314776 RepID=A0A166HJW0_9AGAM|nr:cytochrome P450 [Sistotremastrum suecicum HHB10207 ss-3]
MSIYSLVFLLFELATTQPATMFSSLMFPVLFALLFTTHIIWRRFSSIRTLRSLPGPALTHWIWGNEMELHSSLPGETYAYWSKIYGQVFKFWGVFGTQVICVTDRVAVAQILASERFRFPKPAGARAWFKSISGKGILYVEDKEEHARQRKMIAPAMNFQATKAITPKLFDCAKELADSWELCTKTDADSVAEIDAAWWATRYSLDTIGKAGFSWNLSSMTKGHHLADTLDSLTNTEGGFAAFAMRALVWAFPSVLQIPSAKGKMIQEARLQLRNVSQKLWNDSKNMDKDGDKTLLTLMQEADDLDDEQAVTHMATLISAAFETVSASISWVLYEIAQHPEIQEKLREEVSTDEDPDFDTLHSKFPLLDAVYKETLRLHSPVLELHHVSSKTQTLRLGAPLQGSTKNEILVPKDTVLVVPVSVIQTDPEVWGPDAEHWKPERWLGKRDKELHGKADFLAFSMGPRVCPGRLFAEAEIKVLIIVLLRMFSFECVQPIEPFQSFVVRTKVVGEKTSSLPLKIKRL